MCKIEHRRGLHLPVDAERLTSSLIIQLSTAMVTKGDCVRSSTADN